MLKFTLPVRQRVGLFICITLLCMVMCGVLVSVIGVDGSTPKVRIASVLQDLLLFFVPAVATAILITRRPADFLNVGHAGSVTSYVIVTALALASIPLMNYVIAWNNSLSLPESLGAVERWMRISETNASEYVAALIGGAGISSLVIAMLIIGLLAGFSEELFFRGAFQRLLITGNVTPHIAIWIVAMVFSTIHFQFFGFVPRLLLGAMFGYTAWWCGSLWPAVWAHVLNNLIATYALWTAMRGERLFDGIKGYEESTADPLMALLSAASTAFLLWCLMRTGRSRRYKKAAVSNDDETAAE